MGFLRTKAPALPPAPKPKPEEKVDPLMEERLKRQRQSGRMANYLSRQEQVLDNSLKL